MASQIELRGLSPSECLIEITGEANGVIQDEKIIEQINEIGEELALVLIPGVQYYTGQLFQMEQITAAAHRNGAICGLGRNLQFRPHHVINVF